MDMGKKWNTTSQLSNTGEEDYFAAVAFKRWLVLDASTRRPQRVDKLLSTIQAEDRRVLKDEPGKIPALTEEKTAPQSLGLQVRWSDLDVNRHVNYVRYIGWILDAHPAELHQASVVTALDVNYLGEMDLRDIASIHGAATGRADYCHSIVRSDGQVVCRARTRWERTADEVGGLVPELSGIQK
jgi:medium-chain acyl-[acyl-carrier-protein] hydrolase